MSLSGLTAPTPASLLDMIDSSKAKAKAKANATGATSTSSTSSTSGLAGTTTGTTFLNLLVKELQNQDPTAPMDSTQMVGQMISVYQLDELISINQTLGSATKSTTTTGTTTGTNPGYTSSSAEVAARNALLDSGSTSSNVQAASLAASDPTSTLDFSALNNPHGGK